MNCDNISQQVMNIVNKILKQFDQNKIHVNLCRLNINDINFYGFLRIQQTNRIKSLNLFYNNLTSSSIIKMKQSDWTNLIKLKLNDNFIGHKGCKYLSMMVADQLQQLELVQNHISSYGMAHLAKANWKTFKKINISYNNISVDAFLHISHSKWNKTIETIDLKGNQINQTELLRLFISKLSKIDIIYIQNNPIQQSLKNKCKQLIKEKQNINIKQTY